MRREIGSAKVWRKGGKERIYIETGLSGVTAYLERSNEGEAVEKIWADYYPDRDHAARAIERFDDMIFEKVGKCSRDFDELAKIIEGGE